MTLKNIDQFVQKNHAYVFQRLEELKGRASLAQEPLETGRHVYYLGVSLALSVEEGTSRSPWQEGELLRIQMPFPQDHSQPSQDRISMEVEQFFQAECSRIFGDFMAYYQQKLRPLDIPQATLKIRNMSSRWGSCNHRNNVITLNSKLIHLPLSCLDYVVLHEFCHFIHGNHSKDFYDLLGGYMPDWKARRQEMKAWEKLL